MVLTINERVSLANQFKILAALYPDQSDQYQRFQQILEYGYEGSYYEFMSHFTDPMSDDECQEVIDILEMFTRLEWGYASLKDKSGITESHVIFGGWDSNNEGRQQAYAKIFCTDRARFENLGHRAYANKHFSTIARYRVMLETWKKLPEDKRYDMGKDEILTVLHAWEKERERQDLEIQARIARQTPKPPQTP